MIKIAHRGASGYAPENTINAFRKAIILSADIIELDVRVCKSGDVIIIHDTTVDRTTNGKGKVKKMTLQELQKLDAGNGERIPTLQEALEAIEEKAKVMIEIKTIHAVTPVISIVKKYVSQRKTTYDNYIIATGNLFALKRITKGIPEVRTAIIVKYLPKLVVFLTKKMHTSILQIHSKLVTKRFMKKARQKNFLVYTWTDFKEKSDYIQRMYYSHVDGIISNYPDRIVP